MKSLIHRSTTFFRLLCITFAAVALLVVVFFISVSHAGAIGSGAEGAHLVTIHDRGNQVVISTNAATVGDALKQAAITVDSTDAVEPVQTTKLVGSEYDVNIYRARPVIVVDGSTREKIITPYQSAQEIARTAGITLYDEDTTTITQSSDIVDEGASLVMTIHRATPFTFTLYGATTTARSQAATVGDMLSQKGIHLASDDRVSPDATTPLTTGMLVHVWREGTQTITQNEPVAFNTKQVQDGDQAVGYSAVQTPGQNGVKSVTYQINIIDGKEASRTEIASIQTTDPVDQVTVIGTKLVLTGGYSAARVQIMTAAGIDPSDQGYAAYIIDHENGSWCPTRWQGTNACPATYNPLYAEGADVGYGLCQATPGNKMATAGSDWKTNPVTQMEWCKGYALSRYGSWQAAYLFKYRNGWW